MSQRPGRSRGSALHPSVMLLCFYVIFFPAHFAPAAVRCVRLRATPVDGNGADRNNHTVNSLTQSPSVTDDT